MHLYLEFIIREKKIVIETAYISNLHLHLHLEIKIDNILKKKNLHLEYIRTFSFFSNSHIDFLVSKSFS